MTFIYPPSWHFHPILLLKTKKEHKLYDLKSNDEWNHVDHFFLVLVINGFVVINF